MVFPDFQSFCVLFGGFFSWMVFLLTYFVDVFLLMCWQNLIVSDVIGPRSWKTFILFVLFDGFPHLYSIAFLRL